jgi:hypothetical protein
MAQQHNMDTLIGRCAGTFVIINLLLRAFSLSPSSRGTSRQRTPFRRLFVDAPTLIPLGLAA